MLAIVKNVVNCTGQKRITLLSVLVNPALLAPHKSSFEFTRLVGGGR